MDYKKLNDDEIIELCKEKGIEYYNSKTKITNRCVFNNRGRSVLRPYGISRMLLKDLMQFTLPMEDLDVL
jgi:ribosomal protein S14